MVSGGHAGHDRDAAGALLHMVLEPSSLEVYEHCLVDEPGYEHDEGVMSLRWGGCNTPEFSSI